MITKAEADARFGHRLKVEHRGEATQLFLDGNELRRVLDYNIHQDGYGCELTVKIAVQKDYKSQCVPDNETIEGK